MKDISDMSIEKLLNRLTQIDRREASQKNELPAGRAPGKFSQAHQEREKIREEIIRRAKSVEELSNDELVMRIINIFPAFWKRYKKMRDAAIGEMPKEASDLLSKTDEDELLAIVGPFLRAGEEDKMLVTVGLCIERLILANYRDDEATKKAMKGFLEELKE